jgi:hypothetical protein
MNEHKAYTVRVTHLLQLFIACMYAHINTTRMT